MEKMRPRSCSAEAGLGGEALGNRGFENLIGDRRGGGGCGVERNLPHRTDSQSAGEMSVLDMAEQNGHPVALSHGRSRAVQRSIR